MNRRRGRPPKSKAERKDVDLRIPVTNGQKELIVEAAKLDGADMAAWARPLLVQAAVARLKQAGKDVTGQTGAGSMV